MPHLEVAGSANHPAPMEVQRNRGRGSNGGGLGGGLGGRLEYTDIGERPAATGTSYNVGGMYSVERPRKPGIEDVSMSPAVQVQSWVIL